MGLGQTAGNIRFRLKPRALYMCRAGEGRKNTEKWATRVLSAVLSVPVILNGVKASAVWREKSGSLSLEKSPKPRRITTSLATTSSPFFSRNFQLAGFPSGKKILQYDNALMCKIIYIYTK